MRVVVKFHGVAAPSIEAWRQRVLAQPPGDPQLPGLLRDEMIRRFEQCNGLPPGSDWKPTLTPARFVWRYTADTWVHFILKPKDGGRSREVVVIEIADVATP